MTALLLAALAALPCVFWTPGVESRAMLEAAGVRRLCVVPEQVDVWRTAGFSVSPITEAELASRQRLPVPGATMRPAVASPTRIPFITANGWRVTRHPTAKYVYELPPGKAAIAAAEAFAYGADAVMKIDPKDLGALGEMLTFLGNLEATPAGLPVIADVAVVDDGSPVTGEVMNLLARRNIQFQAVQAPSPQVRINIAMGTAAYPLKEAADPSAFAQKIRQQITDERRALRIYGTESVIGRLTGNAAQARLHLLNYGGREIQGLRIRLRGAYAKREGIEDHLVTRGTTEFTVPRLVTYTVIDLKALR